jgi:hypothetical protein
MASTAASLGTVGVESLSGTSYDSYPEVQLSALPVLHGQFRLSSLSTNSTEFHIRLADNIPMASTYSNPCANRFSLPSTEQHLT